jgi:hypothetical protein
MASMQSTAKLFKNDRKCFPSAESAEESSTETENSTVKRKVQILEQMKVKMKMIPV